MEIDETPLAARGDDYRVRSEMLSLGGAPAFMRRARKVEEMYQTLLDRLQSLRTENLEIVRLRVGQLRALAGDWSALRPMLADPADLDRLVVLHDELAPQLRLPLEPTASHRALRGALRELGDAIEMFNARWERLLHKLDLAVLNQARDEFNRYYLLEKECALGSSRTARLAYRPLAPVTVDDLLQRFPPLRVPAVV